MPEDLLARVSAADPARAALMPEDAREATLRRVQAHPRRRASARRPRLRRVRSRRTLLLAAVLALVVTTGAGVAALSGGQRAGEVERDYGAVTRRIPLPPGYRWPGAGVRESEDGVPAFYAGSRAALVIATLQAGCAWWDAWLRAHAAGDRAAMGAALAGRRRVLALTPRARPGDENAGGIDATTVAAVGALVREARAGRAGPIRSDLAINCAGVVLRGR